MKGYLNWIITGLAAFFAFPTFVLLVSWNALPGDRLYSLKTASEDVGLFLVSKTPLASTLSIKYTERRFNEATILLSKKGSTIGYSYLVSEATKTKDLITQNEDTQAGKELVVKIEKYQQEIEERRSAIKTGSTTVPVAENKEEPTPEPTVKPSQPTDSLPTTSPTIAPSVQTPDPATRLIITANSTEEIVENLENVNKELDKIKEEVKSELSHNKENSSDDEDDKSKNKNKDNGEKGNNKEKDDNENN